MKYYLFDNNNNYNYKNNNNNEISDFLKDCNKENNFTVLQVGK